jgi:flagellar hook-basal body complex protein FliE
MEDETKDDVEEMNADEAEGEAGDEDEFAACKNLNLFAGNEETLAKFADPLVKALDSMSDILEDATEKIMDMVFDDQSDTEQSE